MYNLKNSGHKKVNANQFGSKRFSNLNQGGDASKFLGHQSEETPIEGAQSHTIQQTIEFSQE